MKKILFAVCLLFAMSTFNAPANAKSGGNSNEISAPASQIPSRVKAQLHSYYPGATNVQWYILPPAYYGTTIYQAKFKFNGTKMKINFL